MPKNALKKRIFMLKSDGTLNIKTLALSPVTKFIYLLSTLE